MHAIVDGNRIFATQRGYGDWNDYWEFPGGKIEPGETSEAALHREIQEELDTEIAVGEKLTTIEYEYPELMGIKDSDIDAVLLTHLDCDHANGLPQVKGAKKFLVSADELRFASKPTNKVRYYKGWWKDIPLTTFDWNDTQGPVGKSYDLLGDGSIELINIPGHADGLFAVKVKNEEGKFVLLFYDGGYARKSLEEQITSGIAADKRLQKQSLAWIREQSLNPNCVESLANHDPDIATHVIEL